MSGNVHVANPLVQNVRHNNPVFAPRPHSPQLPAFLQPGGQFTNIKVNNPLLKAAKHRRASRKNNRRASRKNNRRTSRKNRNNRRF